MDATTITLASLCGVLTLALAFALLKLRSAGRSRDKARTDAERLRENAPFGLLIVRGDTVEEANPAAARLLGFEPSDLPGKNLDGLTPEDESLEGPTEFMAPDGSTRRLFVVRSDKDPDTLLLLDDEERAGTEAALRDLEDRYLAVISRVPALVYTTDLATGETAHDGGWLADVPGGPALPVAPEDDASLRAFRSVFTKTEKPENGETENYEGPREAEVEYRLPLEDGRSLRLREEVWKTEKKGGSGFVRGVVLDVTAEREAADALEEVRGIRDAVAFASPLGIAVRSGGRLYEANPSGAEILGATAEEVSGRQYLDFVHPDHERSARAGVRRTDRGDEEPGSRMVWRRTDGREIEVEVRAVPIRYSENPHAALVFFEDVTAREQARKREKLEAENLERENVRLERFVRAVSRDLAARHAEALPSITEGSPEALRAAYGGMGRAIEELSALVGPPDGAEEVDLSEVSRSVANRLARERPGPRDRSVEVIVAGGLVVSGERKALTCAVTDLVENAWQAAESSPRPRIVVGRVEGTGAPVFFVRDNGPGFDMADAGSLFDPGGRGTPNGYINLSEASRVVERHGGHVWAESEPGKGATFYFTL